MFVGNYCAKTCAKKALGYNHTMQLANLANMKDDRAQYIRAKMWRKRNQRIEFPAPVSYADAVMEAGLDPTTAKLNGIFSTIYKVPANSKNWYDLDREWLIVMRDVVLTDASGKRVPFIRDRRRCNKKLAFGFTLSSILGMDVSIKPKERRRGNG